MSQWECLKCGNFNDRFANACESCATERGLATISVKPRLTCEECGHRHRQGIYCHIFVEAPDIDPDDIENGDLLNEDDDDKQGDDDDEDDEIKALKANASRRYDPNDPLPSPKEYKESGFIRCNCTVGIPDGSDRFIPCPKRQYAGLNPNNPNSMKDTIEINTWFKMKEISDELMSQKSSIVTSDQEEFLAKQKIKERNKLFKECLPFIHRFSHLGKDCPPASKCNKAWYEGTVGYLPYKELRDCTPYFSYRPHKGQVDALNLVIMATGQRVVFTGGDRRIIASDIDSGEIICTITRDSGEIPVLYELEEKLISASSNGSMRIFSINHVLSRTKVIKTTWEHSRCIRGLLFSDPVGEGVFCKNHGIENHICEYYTVSEDRKIIVWDQSTSNPIRAFESKALRHHTFTSLSQTTRHLIVGTTDASIFIFTKHNHCERDDVHGCSTPNSKKYGCLQVALRLPPQIVSVANLPPEVISLCTCKTDVNYVYPDYDYNYLPVGGEDDPNYKNLRLYAGDNTGQLTVWTVPEFYGIDYRPVMTKKIHDGPVNKITNTNNYLVTLGDDGIILFFLLESMTKMKSLDVLKWAIKAGVAEAPHVKRKIKSVEIEHDEENGGTMVIGTSYGDLFMLYTGFTI